MSTDPTDTLAPYTRDADALTSGNEAAVLQDGGEAFPAMLEAIAQAQTSILMEMYIFRDDDTGWRFADALVERARAGVEVAVLFDSFGSLTTQLDLWRHLETAGVRVLEFRPLSALLPRLRIGARNHRKVLVVDGRVGFAGGLNIADEYAPTAWSGSNWRDTMVRISGPAALELARMALELWTQAGGEPLPAASGLKPGPANGEVRCAVVGTSFGSLAKRRSVYRAYLHALGAARSHIFLTNAYFVPDRRLRRAIHRARRRGVRVVVLLAGRSDQNAVKFAGRYLYTRLLRWGVEVYEWTERVLHAKTATIDGAWATVGSFNLDRLSAFHNLELNVTFCDAGVAEELGRTFHDDLAKSEQITRENWKLRPWFDRLLEWLCYRFRFWL